MFQKVLLLFVLAYLCQASFVLNRNKGEQLDRTTQTSTGKSKQPFWKYLFPFRLFRQGMSQKRQHRNNLRPETPSTIVATNPESSEKPKESDLPSDITYDKNGKPIIPNGRYSHGGYQQKKNNTLQSKKTQVSKNDISPTPQNSSLNGLSPLTAKEPQNQKNSTTKIQINNTNSTTPPINLSDPLQITQKPSIQTSLDLSLLSLDKSKTIHILPLQATELSSGKSDISISKQQNDTDSSINIKPESVNLRKEKSPESVDKSANQESKDVLNQKTVAVQPQKNNQTPQAIPTKTVTDPEKNKVNSIPPKLPRKKSPILFNPIQSSDQKLNKIQTEEKNIERTPQNVISQKQTQEKPYVKSEGIAPTAFAFNSNSDQKFGEVYFQDNPNDKQVKEEQNSYQQIYASEEEEPYKFVSSPEYKLGNGAGNLHSITDLFKSYDSNTS